jgi:para-aminobenzoate synthetase component 1
MSTNNRAVERQFTGFALAVTPAVKQQMLNWGNQFNICCFMDNNDYSGTHHSYECLLAAGAWKWIKLPAGNAFLILKAFHKQQEDWLFGHIGFGLQKETEQVGSPFPDPVGFPDMYFFVPEHLLLVQSGQVLVSSYSADPSVLMRQVLNMPILPVVASTTVSLTASMDRTDYINRVNALKSHIHRGDCYEINFCQEFSSKNTSIDPAGVFRSLTEISPNPFSVYYKLDEMHLLCASPERFLRVESGTVLSQPIKGTAARNLSDPEADKALASSLTNSMKERSENVMVVDLVRNDLSKVCKPGSVEMEELFGVYSFPQVHQLISTIKGEMVEGLNWIDAIQAAFPMGSMTGAPKKRVLELIAEYELVNRGIFSGSVGYCTPSGNADFNVVIRSILYNSANQYISFLVGSGITWYADAANEYDECLLKAEAMMKALGATSISTHLQ